ncbi:MAG: tail fiber domain-containing protein, partial [Desulfobulbaceae bacterium]|nr:tail fiber domain-containing protein [Desulfobulbaceae bacterium]
SDYRLKENLQAITGACDTLELLPVWSFNFKADPDTRVSGFMAHELQAIIPEAATGEKDEMEMEEYEVSPAVYETQVVPAVYETVTITEEVEETEYDGEGNLTKTITPAVTEEQLVTEETTEEVLVTDAVMDEREVPVYQGVDQSKVVPLLTAAMQELIVKNKQQDQVIADLVQRVEALEVANVR